MAGTDDKAMTSPAFCKNGCGFYGSPNTEGMCSKCFRDLKKDSSNSNIPTGTTCRNENNSAMGTSVMISSLNQGNSPSIGVSNLDIDKSDMRQTESEERMQVTDYTHSSSNATTSPAMNSVTGQNRLSPSGYTTTITDSPSTGNCSSSSMASFDPSSVSNNDERLKAAPVSNANSASFHSESVTTEVTPISLTVSESSPPTSSATVSIPTADMDGVMISDLSSTSTPSGTPSARTQKNRCNVCNKKLGLTGFNCRCEGLFCSIHRYSDGHECSFDYKTEAKNALRKANPKVDGEKINKI